MYCFSTQSQLISPLYKLNLFPTIMFFKSTRESMELTLHLGVEVTTL